MHSHIWDWDFSTVLQCGTTRDEDDDKFRTNRMDVFIRSVQIVNRERIATEICWGTSLRCKREVDTTSNKQNGVIDENARSEVLNWISRKLQAVKAEGLEII